MTCPLCDRPEDTSGLYAIDLRHLADLIAEGRAQEALTILHEAAPDEVLTPATILRLAEGRTCGNGGAV